MCNMKIAMRVIDKNLTEKKDKKKTLRNWTEQILSANELYYIGRRYGYGVLWLSRTRSIFLFSELSKIKKRCLFYGDTSL